MLDINDGKLVVEEKGVYSIEKFIVARRLMYWQVYLHKTVLSAEQLLVNILLRAKELVNAGETLFATPTFSYFLQNNCSESDLRQQPDLLNRYAQLDDYDIFCSIKAWTEHPDPVLSRLCNGMVNRRLYKIRLRKDAYLPEEVTPYLAKAVTEFKISDNDAKYFAFRGSISNSAYDPSGEPICILYRDGSSTELSAASDQMEVAVLSSPIQKHFICVLPELIDNK